jgi:Immunity protein 30
MNETYEMQLTALRHEIEMGGARPSEIDKAVDSLLTLGSTTLASDLLKLLSDSAEYDAGMFTLIHAAESLDQAPYASYVSAILSIFTTLTTSSPRWASIILMRVMNGDSTRHELVRQLRDAPVATKESVRIMCERINEVSPEFLSKTVPISLAAT